MKNKTKSNLEQKRSDEKNKIKKTYQSPQLDVYGSLESLTHGTGGKSGDAPGVGSPKSRIPH